MTKQKWIALLGTLCLLLSGCGDGGAASASSAASSAPAQEAAQTSEALTSAEEPTSAPASIAGSSTVEEPAVQGEALAIPDGLSDAELGAWLWEAVEEQQDESWATDLDLDMQIDIELEGETTTQQVSSRTKLIDKDEDYRYYSSAQSQNTVTETWYEDGTIYLSDTTGNYKAPMDKDAFEEQYSLEDEAVLDIDADNFGTLTAEETDSGYTVTFGDVDFESWMEFSSMLASAAEDVSCSAFSLEGTMSLDQSGNLTRMELTLDAEVTVSGIAFHETVALTETVNGRDGSVSIDAPADDSSYLEMSDISIPSTYMGGYETLLSQYAVSYQDVFTITISDGSLLDTYNQADALAYTYGEDGLSVQWYTSLSANDEVMSETEDVYSGGTGTLTTDEGESTYTYDDDSFFTGITDLIMCYSDSFSYGSDYQLVQDGDYMKLTYTLDSAYVEAVIGNNLESMGTEIYVDEASSVTASGTVSLWYDATGILLSQLVEMTADLDFSGVTLTVSLQDGGDVMAINDNVAMSDA